MYNKEIMDIEVEEKALRDRLNSLDSRKNKAVRELRELSDLVKDDGRLKEDAKASEVNYTLGHSEGYVCGFSQAINVIVDALASEYRDIPITESELYMLVELGELRCMARQKNMKSKRIAEKAGWEYDWHLPFPTWEKKEQEEQPTDTE